MSASYIVLEGTSFAGRRRLSAAAGRSSAADDLSGRDVEPAAAEAVDDDDRGEADDEQQCRRVGDGRSPISDERFRSDAIQQHVDASVVH